MAEITIDRVTQRLNDIYELESKTEYYQHGAARETLAEIRELREQLGALPGAPKVTSCFPAMPSVEKQVKYEEALAESEKKKPAALIGVGVFALCAFLFLVCHLGGFFAPATVSFFVAAFLGYKYMNSVTTMKLAKSEYDKEQAKYTETMTAFRNALTTYEQEKAKGIEAASEYGIRYREAYNRYLEMVDVFDAKLQETKAEIDALHDKVYSDTDFSSSNDRYLSKIYDMLSGGRADTYKEALNLAIVETRAEEDMAARREAEQRQEMMMQQQMQRQMEEQRRHNEQMEYQQKLAQDEQKKQYRDQEKKAYQLCYRCRLYHNGCKGGIVGCGNFREK